MPETVSGDPFLSKRFFVFVFSFSHRFLRSFPVIEYFYNLNCVFLGFGLVWFGGVGSDIGVCGISGLVQMMGFSVHIIGQKAQGCFLACMFFYLHFCKDSTYSSITSPNSSLSLHCCRSKWTAFYHLPALLVTASLSMVCVYKISVNYLVWRSDVTRAFLISRVHSYLSR